MIHNLSARLQTLFVLVGLVILFGIASPHFLTTDNLLNVMQQSAINAILGIGLTFVIISAGIDLSVGSILALCGLVVADLLVAGHSTLVAVGAGLLVGLACGAATGLITTLGRIPPFITTLGMMLIARSAAKIYSGSKPISGLPESFRSLSGDVAGVPVLVLIVATLYVLAHLVLTRTKLGRYAYAIGGNEQAAWLSGVPVGRYKVAIYALSGLMAGVAAVLMTSRLNAASPLSGEMYELYAIAAAVIGGVSLMGGEGRVLGTLLGALIMGTLRNGLNALNVPSALEGMVVGGVLTRHSRAGSGTARSRLRPPLRSWRCSPPSDSAPRRRLRRRTRPSPSPSFQRLSTRRSGRTWNGRPSVRPPHMGSTSSHWPPSARPTWSASTRSSRT
jgi:ribose transport system permease protein